MGESETETKWYCLSFEEDEKRLDYPYTREEVIEDAVGYFRDVPAHSEESAAYIVQVEPYDLELSDGSVEDIMVEIASRFENSPEVSYFDWDKAQADLKSFLARWIEEHLTSETGKVIPGTRENVTEEVLLALKPTRAGRSP